MLIPFLSVAGATVAALLLGAGVLHVVPKLGVAGRRASEALCRAPMLDLVVTYFTVAPMIVGAVVAGWAGLGGAILGQFAGLVLWTLLHELANRRRMRGVPRIFAIVNRKVGPVRNMAAVYWTAVVTPLFWLVRVAEVFCYPVLPWLIQFPKYSQGEWVNVSRHKFSGLVGHDLIWCLYCDWMTGVWSLGTEMLRNVESFWCPIRFASDKKCANCRHDFPDIYGGWVPADRDMHAVAEMIEAQYPPEQRPRAWFGHPVRVTVKGREIDEEAGVPSPETVGVK